jgi:hypothetical protein
MFRRNLLSILFALLIVAGMALAPVRSVRAGECTLWFCGQIKNRSSYPLQIRAYGQGEFIVYPGEDSMKYVRDTDEVGSLYTHLVVFDLGIAVGVDAGTYIKIRDYSSLTCYDVSSGSLTWVRCS